MHRPASPLLHDYKPSAARKPAKSKALWWFAAGLGIPLFGVALVTGLNTDDPLPPVSDTPVMTSANSVALPVDEMDPAAITSDVLEPEIVVEPEPEFDQATLTVGRGDTMEKLFRENNLDIGAPYADCSA